MGNRSRQGIKKADRRLLQAEMQAMHPDMRRGQRPTILQLKMAGINNRYEPTGSAVESLGEGKWCDPNGNFQNARVVTKVAYRSRSKY